MSVTKQNQGKVKFLKKLTLTEQYRLNNPDFVAATGEEDYGEKKLEKGRNDKLNSSQMLSHPDDKSQETNVKDFENKHVFAFRCHGHLLEVFGPHLQGQVCVDADQTCQAKPFFILIECFGSKDELEYK
ncbi:hypothetical protein DAPPUDRAFT_261687 [Daphnia pulex]|uniref:Uncharacterized protein n=1 Tax=Daphnia pulex TaxID=6669 RepID=E9HLG3_DAPPU|nr:hypothetical protein DAPPUDRAFT_261687 [Daphnia pulex]|eukprot:EFX67436.1 hypothetical protein DAPPUDRAFT_261687 [Daphnia pulex]